jgi:hypothetical protein
MTRTGMSEVEQRRERLPSERARQSPGAAQRGDGDAGMDARGGATHGADAEDAARLGKARRNAWVLGGVALALYLGYMVWFLIRGSIG